MAEPFQPAAVRPTATFVFRVPERASMIPGWLHVLSILSLVAGFACCAVIVLDEYRHPQHMWIMNVVWPVVALFGSVVWLWAYFAYGRLATHEKMHAAMQRDEEPPSMAKTPFGMMVFKGTSHCGSGCALGDIVAEWLLFAVPVIAVWFGWKSLFPEKIFAAWVADYILALRFGIAFQYFTIKPMRNLSVGRGSSRRSRPTCCRSRPGRSACTVSWRSPTSGSSPRSSV